MNMKLYLARHGDYALDTMTGQDKLTEKGVLDIEKLAAFLRPLKLPLSQILHSSKLRAKQTAEILTQGFHCEELPQPHAGLNPEDDVTVLAESLIYEDKDILLVGHLPFMGK